MGIALHAKVAASQIEVGQPDLHDTAPKEDISTSDVMDNIAEVLAAARERQPREVLDEHPADLVGQYTTEKVVDDVVVEEPRPTDPLDDYTPDELPTEDRVVDETNPKDPLTGPDQSVEIGGPQVEAEIAEIKELQKTQELERSDQAAEMAERREQLAEKYADSPEQHEYLKQFDGAAHAAEQALVAQQAVEMQQLQQPPPPPPPQL
jgi:hypothetical protein